jgi:hypothetical protein
MPCHIPQYILLTDVEALQRAGITTPVRSLRHIHYSGQGEILVKRHGRLYVVLDRYTAFMAQPSAPKRRNRTK